MAITVTDISALIDRYGNEVVHMQSNLAAPVLDVMEKHKSPSVGVVNIKGGGIDSTSMIADGGSLTTGASKDLTQATYTGINVFSRLSIPRQAALTAVGQGDGINLVMEQLETVGADLGRQLGRAIFGSALTAEEDLSASIGASGTSYTAASIAEFREGQILHRVDPDAGTPVQEAIRVTKVVPDADGFGGTVTLVRDIDSALPNTTPTTAEQFYLQGGYANQMVSLEDVSADANLYSVSKDSDDWHGNLISSVGTLALTDLRQATTLIHRRSKSPADCAFASPAAAMLIGDLQVDGRRFLSGAAMDKYEKGPDDKMYAVFEGIRVYVEPNCKDSDIHFVNKKDQKIHEFIPMGVDKDGAGHSAFSAGSTGAGRSGLLISDSTLTYDAQFWGSYNLRVTRRSSHCRLTGITG